MVSLQVVYNLPPTLSLVNHNTNQQTTTRVVFLQTLTKQNTLDNFCKDDDSTQLPLWTC
jgi:hypothetical protein